MLRAANFFLSLKRNSNLESFNFDSGILSFNQVLYALQIYNNKVLNMNKLSLAPYSVVKFKTNASRHVRQQNIKIKNLRISVILYKFKIGALVAILQNFLCLS